MFEGCDLYAFYGHARTLPDETITLAVVTFLLSGKEPVLTPTVCPHDNLELTLEFRI